MLMALTRNFTLDETYVVWIRNSSSDSQVCTIVKKQFYIENMRGEYIGVFLEERICLEFFEHHEVKHLNK